MRPPLKWLLLLLAVGLPLVPGWPGAAGVSPALAQETANQALLVEADRLYQQGIEQYQRHLFREALQSWEQVLGIYRTLGDQTREAGILNNLGIVNTLLGSYPMALEYYEQSLAIKQEIGDRAAEAATLNNIGEVYRLQENYVEALVTYQQSLTISRDLGDHVGEANSLRELGIVSNKLNNYEQAIDYHQQSLALYRELENRQEEADALRSLGIVYDNSNNHWQAIDYHQQSLVIYRELENRKGEADALRSLGIVYDNLNNHWQAIDYHQQSLAIYRELENREGEADALRSLGIVYDNLNNHWKAIDYHQQSLAIYRELENRQEEADTLRNLGSAYEHLGNHWQAIDYYQESLAIYHELENRQGEADILDSLGFSYDNLSQYQKAIDYHQQSLEIAYEIEDRQREARSLGGLGLAHNGLGECKQAIGYHQQSLMIDREINNHHGEMASLGNLGLAYSSLGQYQQAIDFYSQTLAIARHFRYQQDEAIVLGNMGSFYLKLGQYQQAIGYLQQSLIISREIDYHQREAIALGTLGIVYAELEQYQQAIDYYQQSLEIAQKLGYRDIEAAALQGIGNLYNFWLNQYPQTINYYQQSLAISREIGNRDMEAGVLVSIGIAYYRSSQNKAALEAAQQALALARDIQDPVVEWKSLAIIAEVMEAQGKPELAIVFYKQAVNVIEAIRTGINTFSLEDQQAFAQTVEGVYRSLANLLLEQGPNRILEAQQVLELLKIEEIRKFTRATYTTNGLRYDPVEQAVVGVYQSLMAVGAQIYDCNPNCDQYLIDQQITLEAHYDEQVATLEATVRQNRAVDDVFYDPASLSSDALDLVNAQPGTVLLYPVVLEDRLWLLWTATGGVVGSVEVPVTQAELSGATLRFRELLERQDAQSYAEFKTVAQQLYGWLIAPLQPELEQNTIRHLIFAQDRTTRYLPMAALYDGNQYLLETYTISTVLSAALTDTQGRLGDVASTTALGLGLTRAIPGFSPLPNVAQELTAVIRSSADTNQGIYPGQIFLDEAFTFEALSQNVRQANILHIATHAAFVPSTQGESYILSGTGQRLALADIGALDTQFRNLHLVVLSACQTALGGAALDGTEIAGVSSYFLGRNKAETVMATLWKVDDAGTSLLMQRFYALLATGKMTKAEALRQAQLSLLLGETTLDQRFTNLGIDRGGLVNLVSDESVDLAHPYYWAPFILIGNPL